MKKSITDNKKMTVEEVIRILVYRPYGDALSVMVDEEERVHIKGDTWIVILDHNTGDFYFSGELNRYYDIDMIESIRDCFGEMYSIFNVMYSSIEKDTWYLVDCSFPELDELRVEYDQERKERMIQYKKDYYEKRKERARQGKSDT